MPELHWTWFVIIVILILCTTLVIIGKHGRRDLADFQNQMPKLPAIPPPEEMKYRDDRIMQTAQEGWNDDQTNIEGR